MLPGLGSLGYILTGNPEFLGEDEDYDYQDRSKRINQRNEQNDRIRESRLSDLYSQKYAAEQRGHWGTAREIQDEINRLSR